MIALANLITAQLVTEGIYRRFFQWEFITYQLTVITSHSWLLINAHCSLITVYW
jgi:hypothetical protein